MHWMPGCHFATQMLARHAVPFLTAHVAGA